MERQDYRLASRRLGQGRPPQPGSTLLCAICFGPTALVARAQTLETMLSLMRFLLSSSGLLHSAREHGTAAAAGPEPSKAVLRLMLRLPLPRCLATTAFKGSVECATLPKPREAMLLLMLQPQDRTILLCTLKYCNSAGMTARPHLWHTLHPCCKWACLTQGSPRGPGQPGRKTCPQK